MGEIHILDSRIFNRIAAGEVVENPASIVKELVENSVDAGAKNIAVEIADGGQSLIKVTDDGKGIAKDDLPLAFMPHATSKISSLGDLNAIGTLGFRGEALPSIASVAKITMTTRKVGDETGNRIVYENGVVLSAGEVGAPEGTTVTVENLFENIPARKKFLKSAAAECARVTDFMQRFALANYGVSVRYTVNGKKIFQSGGGGLDSAVYTVYGDQMQNFDYITYTMPDITLQGYVSKPSFTKSSRSHQTLIVNGRVVESNDVSTYMFLCYKDFLMSRQFPLYILYLTVPLDMVDVNVHPNKTAIKFADLSGIKRAIFSVVRDKIGGGALVPKEIDMDYAALAKKSGIRSDVLFPGQNEAYRNYRTFTASLSDAATVREERTRKTDAQNADAEPVFVRHRQDVFSDVLSDNITVAGKLFNTYIVVQQDDKVYFIDQHAAHEKIIYEKYSESVNSRAVAVQSLMLPYVFGVNAVEKETLAEHCDALEKLGFSFNVFGLNGDYYSLSSVPAVCAGINLKEFTADLFENLIGLRVKNSDFLRETIMRSACKAAVKGTDNLQHEEIVSLLNEMKRGGNALFCPHGRPTVISITKTEIEKWFKRIV
ncbi:MAG: DNA mismatch repair endonuclease MutL [Clostridiales bacterium]|jgi:DNA mismatch repair protein MutL|nr:DNA mismatch repair endonuclease MutL [Clostridiales bacterium]